MIQQLNPLENFPIVRQLEDPTDNATYFVQATVYDGKNNALLATLNLASQGGQLYTYLWQVVADSSGMGRFIYMTIKVYTDAGYTQLSPKYGIINDTFLVQNRVNAALLGGGTYDYARFEKITRKVVEDLVVKIIEDKIGPIGEEIRLVSRRKHEDPDFSEIRQSIEGAARDIKSSMPGRQDLSSFVTKHDLKEIVGESISAATREMGGHMGSLPVQVRKIISEEISKSVGSFRRETVEGLEDKLIEGIARLLVENLGRTSVVMYPERGDDAPKPKITETQLSAMRKMLRRGMSKEKIMESIA